MADEELKARVDAYVDEVWEDVVSDIDYLVRVESVEDLSHAEPGKPWGPAPFEALSRGLEIAARLGLDAHNVDGYIGYADLAGNDPDRYLATIAHTDVVPLGQGWTVDPLRVTRRDGYLLGRGVLDDKGPFVLSLYAAHFFVREVQQTGRRLPITLRAIVGNNEETNMADVEYYLEHFPEPEFLFTPDADFPLICGEKGGLQASFTSADLTGPYARILDFEAGTVANAIPGSATATIRANADQLPAADAIAVEPAGEGLAKLTAHGKGGHASKPEGTVNAIGLIVEYLLDNGICSEDEREFLEFEHLVFGSTDGSSLGISCTDDLFEPLTAIGGTIRLKEGRLVQTIDVRYPKSITGSELQDRLGRLGERYGATMEVLHDMVPFYVPPTSPEIETLLSTYNEFTGHHDRAFTIGGGTYARHFKRACAFGPHDERIKTPAWVGSEHTPDEGISEAQLRLALRIYIVAIARLMRLYR